jgi:short-subunit dehydrogenase
MKTIRGKTALITGASRGIGTYISKALAEKGMNLVLAARSAFDLINAASEIRSLGTKVLTIPADVGKRSELESLAKRAEEESGGIDVLVNNAGLEKAYPYDKISTDVLDQIIEVNLVAPMILSRLLIPKMIERGEGHIVNIASLAGLAGVAYEEVYAATKHGLVGFTRSLRLTAIGERYPVRASVICPGFISDAGMYENTRKDTGIEAPFAFGTSPPENVARSVVRAILNDIPEIVVNSRPIRPLLLAQVLSPRFSSWCSNKFGGVEVFKRSAQHNMEESPFVGKANNVAHM